MTTHLMSRVRRPMTLFAIFSADPISDSVPHDPPTEIRTSEVQMMARLRVSLMRVAMAKSTHSLAVPRRSTLAGDAHPVG